MIEFKTIVPLKMEFELHDKQEYVLELDTKKRNLEQNNVLLA